MPAQAPRQSIEVAALPLLDLIPAVSPHLVSPRWLKPYADRLDAALGKSTELVVAAPPQNGKTEVTKHALAKWLSRTRDVPFYYVTYNQERSDRVAADFWYLAERFGLRPVGRKAYWRSAVTGSRVMFTSIGGGITGEPLPAEAVIIIDDPIKDREEALSRARRARAWGWLFGSVMTRRHPGSSLLCMATRWATDDPSGMLIKEFGFEYLNIPAICEDEASDPVGRKLGEILWDHHSLAEYRRLEKVDPWGFAAMYQGRPTPRGEAVFRGLPTRFMELPSGAYRTAYGVDLAYSKDSRADRSVCLRMQRVGDVTYLTAARLARVESNEFTLTLRAMQAEFAGPMWWYASGTEKGAGSFIKVRIPNFIIKPATADKYVRATEAVAGWNLGNIALPDEGSPLYGDWVDDVIDEVMAFTGTNDPHDDVVDALAAGWDALNPKRTPRSVTTGGGKDRHDRTVY